MMRALTFLFGMLLGACTAYQPATPAPVSTPSRVEQASQLRAMTVALVAHSEAGETIPFCTGVWVSETAILTAFHCVAAHVDERLVYVTESDALVAGPTIRERATPFGRASFVTAVDPLHDLALLRAIRAPKGHAIARVAVGDVLQGQGAQTVGHPMRLWFSYSHGDVSAVRVCDASGDEDLDPATTYVQTTTPISMGNSGGGLFDEHGMLIGIAHAFVDHGQNLNLFVGKRHIEALLLAQGSSL